MKRKVLLALPAALLLASCGGTGTASSSESAVTTPAWSYPSLMSPTGAPALAFYSYGDAQFWETGTAAEIRPNFMTDTYGALVIDSITGLNVINGSEDAHFKLARFLTGGNFHIVSTTHGADDVPTADSRILSFNAGSLPDQVFTKLAEDVWNWDELTYGTGGNVTYVNSTAEVAQQLIANPTAYDYYFIAEPSLTQARNSLSESGITVTEVYDLRAEWEDFTGAKAIPQAALFVSETYAATDDYAYFLDEIDNNIDNAVNHPDVVVEAMNEYSEVPADQAARFGFNASQVASLQAEGANRFGMVLEGEIEDSRAFVNDFYEDLTGTAGTYGEDLFL